MFFQQENGTAQSFLASPHKMFRRSSSTRLASVSIDDDNVSVRSKSSTFSNLANKIIVKPRLPSFRKNKGNKSSSSAALATNGNMENHQPINSNSDEDEQVEFEMLPRKAECSMVQEGDEEEQAPSFYMSETKMMTAPQRPPSSAPTLNHHHNRAAPESPPKKSKFSAPLEGSFLEDGRAEREAMIDALKMQLSQALEELEEADRIRITMTEAQNTMLALKTQLEMTQIELKESEAARAKSTRESAHAMQQLRLELEQTKQELEISKKSKQKMLEIAAHEQHSAVKRAAPASAVEGSFRRADPSELALKAQNQQLQNQVLRLESDVARLKTKLVTNECPETASMRERRLREQDEQFQRAVNAARQLFVEGTITKQEYDEIVQSAERVSLAYL